MGRKLRAREARYLAKVLTEFREQWNVYVNKSTSTREALSDFKDAIPSSMPYEFQTATLAAVMKMMQKSAQNRADVLSCRAESFESRTRTLMVNVPSRRKIFQHLEEAKLLEKMMPRVLELEELIQEMAQHVLTPARKLQKNLAVLKVTNESVYELQSIMGRRPLSGMALHTHLGLKAIDTFRIMAEKMTS